MSRMFRVFFKFILSIFIVAFLFIASSPLIYKYLKMDAPQQSKILLLEAWAPSYVIEKAKNTFFNKGYEYIIVVGANYRIDPISKKKSISPKIRSKYNVFKNGYLSVSPSWFSNFTLSDSIYNIEIEAMGKEVLGINPHFYLVINNKIIDGVFTSPEYQTYQFAWKNKEGCINSFNILYTNDAYISGSDRNLYVRGIKFNGFSVPLSDSIITRVLLSERSVMPERVAFKSLAECTGKYLTELGVPEDKIIILSSDYYTLNKTLSNAKSFASWFEQSPLKGSPINIFTFDIHSRRTFVTFKSELKGKAKVGTIISENLEYPNNNWWEDKKRIKLFVSESIQYFIAHIISFF